MIKFLKICCLIFAICLAGCSALTEFRSDMADKVFGREPPNPAAKIEDFTASYATKVDWSVQTGDTDKYDYTPALFDGAVYAANAKGEIMRLDVTNGRQAWRVNTKEIISGGVGIGPNLVLVGSSKGNVLAYDMAGKFLWKAKVSSEVLSAPRFFDGYVIARTGNSHIFGLDAATGERKWVYERSMPALTLRNSAGIVVDGGAVYAGFAGGKMAAVRADNGKLIWEATVAQPKGVTEIERIADITSLPFVDGPLVYAVAYQGRIAAIDRVNGKVVWNRDISSFSGLTAEDSRIFVSHTLGSVYSLDYTTGRTFWRQGALANRRLTTPLSMGSLLAVGDLEGYIHFLSRDDGKFVGRIKVDGEPVMSLVAGNNSQVLAATRGGGLYAIRVGDDATKQTTVPIVKPAAEKSAVPAATPVVEPTTSPTSETSAEPSSERSILFQKNDSILLPEAIPEPK